MSNNDCESFVQEALAADVNSPEWAAWQQHADKCTTCAGTLAVLERLEGCADAVDEGLDDGRREALLQAARGALAHSHDAPRAMPFVLWAAAAAVVLGLGMFTWLERPHDNEQSVAVAVPAVPEAAKVVAEPLSSRDMEQRIRKLQRRMRGIRSNSDTRGRTVLRTARLQGQIRTARASVKNNRL